jgi:hypothetical protein
MVRPALNLIRNIVFVTVLASVIILAAEYAVRWFIPVPDWHRDISVLFANSRPGLPDLGIPHSEIRMARVGEYDVTIRFNRHGLRDKRDITEAGADEIIFLGDSQTFGFGIHEHERFSKLVGDKLGVGTYNIAVPTDIRGYKQLLGFAVNNGAQAQRLVVGLSMETDVLAYPNIGQSESLIEAPAEATEEPVAVHPLVEKAQPESQIEQDLRSNLLPLKHWLRAHSALYFAVTSFVQRSPVLRDLAIDAGLIKPAVNDLDPQLIERTVAALQNLCSGYDCTILLIPSRALWASRDPRTERRGHEALVEMLRNRGLTVVDPRARMEAGGSPLDYFYLVDGHVNVSWNVLAAEMVAAAIITKFGLEGHGTEDEKRH